MKFVYVGFTFPHHRGTHAGYQHLKEYLKYDYFVNCEHVFDKIRDTNDLLIRAFYFINRKIWRFPVFPSHILKCILLGLNHNDLIFHFIYPENTYLNFRRFIRKGNKIVLTIHQPFDWYENKLWRNRLRSADAIIVLSEAELSSFQKAYGKDKVTYIPHGIDTNFYFPDNTISKEPIVLTVGNWLRDFSFADEVFKKIQEHNGNVRFVVVTLPANQQYFKDTRQVTFLSGISDEELRELYRKCMVLFLPLVRFTANNALLEAASCGCNILIASNHSDNSYIPNEYIHTERMDVDKVVKEIESFLSLNSNPINNKLSTYIDQYYSWKIIAGRVLNLLNRLK